MKRSLTALLGITAAITFAAAPSDAKFVTYRDFGAKGDGKTDDFEPIVKAHRYANEKNLPVRADDNAAYYLGGDDLTAEIQTDTDWGKARFIIDDTAVKNRGAHLFSITSKLKSFAPEGLTSLKRDQTKIDLKLPQPCLIIATNDEVMQYIRLGANANSGAAQTDIFIADADGKIDPNAPILWDFSKISKVTAYPIDEKTLTVKGGIFTTIANREQGQHQYYSRGLAVRRSNTVLDGIEHRITGESEKSWPYNGFVNIADCAGVTVKNCLLTGHKCYRNINRNGKEVTTGTYDITANRALNITFLNCTQTNDIDDSAYWGLMGTNYCKNIILDGCKFSRFDAHKGVANATIRNSTLGHMGLKAIGAGTLLVENTTVRSGRFIDMRPDYGSTWRGEFIIRNCTFIPAGGKKTAPVIIGGSNSGQHDFGYPCFMPSRIVIDGLTIDDNPPDDCAGPVIFGDFNPKYTGPDYREKFPYAKTQEVVISKLTVKSGTGLRLSNNPAMFRNVKVTGTPVKRD